MTRQPLLFSWVWRRAVVIATLLFAAGMLIYITVWGRDTGPINAIATGLVALVPVVVGTYVLGGVWDDRNARSELVKLPAAERRTAMAPQAAVPRSSILSALPWTWQLAIGAGGIVLLLAIAGGIYLKGHADGDAGGYARASAFYGKREGDQAAANKAAADAANKELLQRADQQAKTDAAYDAALAQIEAGSGGEGAATGGLDPRRINDLNSIR